ncbi:MAG TPA: SDR family NAD(P)-dependent oxidoreductase, partial [Deltaproteobacteria bacterium]|nr:SDR family NAD(P)-dependent oxidoreductase [Deltaproteobacteria bacterium]
VSSAAGLMGMYGYTAYGTSKFALVGFAECLRCELEPMGIHVTLVCPGEVDTPFVPREAEHLPLESRVIKSFCGRISPDRVARAIVKAVASERFLVTPGVLTTIMYTLHRLSGGFLTRHTSDLVVRLVGWYARRGTPPSRPPVTGEGGPAGSWESIRRP